MLKKNRTIKKDCYVYKFTQPLRHEQDMTLG